MVLNHLPRVSVTLAQPVSRTICIGTNLLPLSMDVIYGWSLNEMRASVEKTELSVDANEWR